jgi:hypothetical protein
MIDIFWARGSGPTRALVAATFAGLVALAWANRFIQDDAFISFRYADNLARGLGLVWNEGERVEGYSNFLWTLLIAGGIKLGLDPVPLSQVIGLFLFVVTLFCSMKLAKLLFRSDALALAAVIFLGTNHTFSAFATGGLETQLQAALLAAALYATVLAAEIGELTRARCFGLGLLFSAAILTRLDSFMPCGIMGLFLAFALRRAVPSWRERGKLALFLTGPLVIILGSWFLWKLGYYGSIIPNSFHVKGPGLAAIPRGLNYLYVFVTSYWLIAVLPVAAYAIGRTRLPESPSFLLLGILVATWLAYVVALGGDFMEFRFLVPVLPSGFLLLTWMIFVFIRRPVLQAALALLVLAGSVHHSQSFAYLPEDAIESTWRLEHHVADPDEQWKGIGLVLRDAFGPSSTVTIATTAAGAIPYYSRLRTIDMLGINDPWISTHGASFLPMAGHGKITTLDHLLATRVNLVLSHPILIGGGAPITMVGIPLGDVQAAAPERRVVHIPIDRTHTLLALYLLDHPEIDSVIAARGWRISLHRP